MESKNVIALKRHPMNIKFTNTWYTSQVPDNLDDYVVVDVTSRCIRDKSFMKDHPTFHKDVSPLYVGPITASDGMEAKVFEHFWQASKVYPCHFANGELTSDYFSWRKMWFNKPFSYREKVYSRHPYYLLGYQKNDCLFSVYYENGKYIHLDYIEARKKLYIPEYAKFIVNTESYKWLKRLYDQGKKIALVDFDGYNYTYDGALKKLYKGYLNKCHNQKVKPMVNEEDFLNLRSVTDVVNCGFTPMGHSFVIKMLLEGDIEVVDNKVIDHIGVLN